MTEQEWNEWRVHPTQVPPLFALCWQQWKAPPKQTRCSVCGADDATFQYTHAASKDGFLCGWVIAYHCRDCQHIAAGRAVASHQLETVRLLEAGDPQAHGSESEEWRFVQGKP